MVREGRRKGDASAMTNLGWLYADGHGVARDYAKAREWYEKAAAEGRRDRHAQPRRALPATVAAWRRTTPRRASGRRRPPTKGAVRAMSNLGLLYENGQGVAQDYAKAREWYEKAAAKGDARGKERLKQLPIR